MKPAEKDAEMKRFSDGKTNIMVATTVIEVGVNVPNAVMIIESAERFGLSASIAGSRRSRVALTTIAY
jgi:ATP-dependent DNA helicase RecG